MDGPSPNILTSLGLGAYAASIVSLIAFLGYVITWIAPLVPAPSATVHPVLLFLYTIMNKIAGNVGHATNANAGEVPKTS